MHLRGLMVKSVLALGLILLLFTPIWAEQPEGFPAPGKPGGKETFRAGRLIVKFRPEARAREREGTLARAGVALAREIPALSLSLVSVPPGREEEYRLRLEADPAVEYAELDYLVWTQEEPNDPDWNKQWGLPQIGAPDAWDIATGGSDVSIAVIDTGVDLGHPDLASKLWHNPGEIAGNGLDDDGNGKIDDIHGWDFASDPDDADPSDDHGHGTHVAGIAGASTNNGVGVAGLSWGAELMAVKVLDSTGSGYYSDVVDGIAYAVDEGAKVLNLSLGGTSPSPPLRDAVNYAASHGVLVMAAAGNCQADQPNPCRVLYPAAYTACVAIAATDSSNHRASFSRYGPELDIAAPGVGIYSTLWDDDNGSCYGSKSGTSMATPFVSGLAALLWSYRPSLTAAQVRSLIETRAADVNSAQYPCWDRYLGWARIDAHKTLSTLDDVIYPCHYFFPWVAKGAG